MFNETIELLGWTLLHFVWQGLVVGLIAAVVLAVMRRRSANARYLTGVVALGVMSVLPPVTLGWLYEPPSPFGESPIVMWKSFVEVPDESSETGTTLVERFGMDFENPLPPDAVPIRLEPASKSDQASLPFGLDRWSWQPALPWIVSVWLAGVVVLSVRLLFSWLSVQGLRRRSSQSADERWQALLHHLAERLRVTRPVKLVESALVEVPAVIGWLRPVILLPAAALTGLTTEQLEALLAHELAHVRRHDYLINLLQTVVETLLFYHPAVWWLSHRIRVEREHCCDDLAVQVCGDGLTYAKALVALEELRAPNLSLAMSSSGGSLVTRVARLLGAAEQQRRPTGWIAGLLSLVLLTMAGALGAGLLTPPDKPTAGLPNDRQPTTTKSDTNEETSGPDQQRGQEIRTERAVESKDQSKTQEDNHEPAKSEIATHPITVNGRALNLAGEPIPGAKIYLASVSVDYKRLAETTTDAEGRYVFRDVPLPINTVHSNPHSQDSGGFELFGQAKGCGFAWRPVKWYYPKPQPAFIKYHNDEKDDLPNRFHADEAIVLDLKFPKPASLTGRVVDEQGKPIAAVNLAMRICEPLDEKNVAEGKFGRGDFSALNQPDDVPAEIKIRRTDTDGRFEFTELPPDCLFRFDAIHPDYARKSVFAATTSNELPKLAGRHTVFTNEIALTFVAVQDISVRVVLADTEQPAPKVLVGAEGRDGADSSYQTTDEQGKATLRLPTGEYRMNLLPQKGTPYLATNPIKKLIVGEQPSQEPITLRLKPGCVLSATIVDADTGKGISGVDLWMSTPDADRSQRREVEFRSWLAPTSFVERPVSDADGKLQVIVEPGRHCIGAGLRAYPKTHEVDESGVVIDCPASKTIETTIRLKPRSNKNRKAVPDLNSAVGGTACFKLCAQHRNSRG